MRNYRFLPLIPMLYCFAAAAPACEAWNEQKSFEKSDSVFVARVVGTEEVALHVPIGKKQASLLDARFKIIESIKGTPPAGGIVKSAVTARPGSCDIVLAAGKTYLFFIQNSMLLASRALNTQPLDDLDGIEEKALLERIRAFR